MRLAIILGALVLAGAGTFFIAARRPHAPPAPAPSVFGDVASLDPAAGSATATPASKGDVPVSSDEKTLRAGSIMVDLTRPAEELDRLVSHFRRVHAEFRADRAAHRAEVFEAGTALGQLLMKHHELGPAFFKAALQEPHPDGIRDLAPLLKLAPSEPLHRDLVAVLDSGGPAMTQYLAAAGLEGSRLPGVNAALVKAWLREEDLFLRRRITEVVALHLGTDEAIRKDYLATFRRAARGADANRRAEALFVIIEGQAAAPPEADRALVRELLEAEKDPAARRILDLLARRIKP
jgi:hypothetical protein